MESNQQKQPQKTAKAETLQKDREESTQDSFELVLNWYKLNGKNLAGEEALSKLSIRKLMKILGNPIWNQLYHCWTVELKHMPELQPYVEHTFDPEKYVYFIEAYSTT